MKKWLLFILLPVSYFPGFAQISKGQWLVGGSASFSYSQTDGNFYNSTRYITTTWQLSPGTGYFFLNNVAAGLRVNGMYTNNHQREGLAYTQQLSLSPFMRYYFLPKAQKLNLLLDGAYLYGWYRYRFIQAPASGGSSSVNISKSDGYSLTAGPVIFLNPKTALELTVNYRKDYGVLNDENSARVTIMGGAGLQVHLGK